MAKYPVITIYNDNGIERENNFTCNGLKELKETLISCIKQGDKIKNVDKINKFGEYVTYNYKKLIKGVFWQ